MKVLHSIVALGVMAVVYGIPMTQAQSNSQTLVPGVFIPADAFKKLQDRANANQQPTSNQMYQPSANVQTVQPVTNQMYQPTVNPQPTYQPVVSNQPQYNYQYQPQPTTNQQVMAVQPNYNNQPVLTNQPVATNQVQPVVPDQIVDQNSNQPTIVLTNQPNQQPNQVIYVQQPVPNQQTVYVPQNQPTGQSVVLTQQPNQGLVVPNGQLSQPSNVVIGNPSNVNQPQGQNPVYTLIPLSRQNSNANSGSYVIPIPSGNSNPIVLNTGK